MSQTAKAADSYEMSEHSTQPEHSLGTFFTEALIDLRDGLELPTLEAEHFHDSPSDLSSDSSETIEQLLREAAQEDKDVTRLLDEYEDVWQSVTY